MSFLSRRPSRSGSRDGDAGRDDEYGDYDYAPDGYGGEEDESWSPGEYFSPEGIKGRWADGHRSADRGDARGRRGDARRGEAGRGDARGDSGRGDQGLAYEDQADDGYNGYAPGNGYGYGADEYASGAYDLAEGSDEEPAERGGRRRKEAGERTGIFRLRRDRGEDIWPDDGISDEDYWASVASDRPLTGPGSPHEADPLAADAPPMGRAGNDTGPRPPVGAGDDVRAAAAGPRLDADSRTGADQRFGDEQRGVTGRLGPPPGLRGDYQPGGGPSAPRPGTGPQARPGTGPQARPGTGPQARPGTGPMPARPGATSAGAAGAWSSQAGFAQSGSQQPDRPSGPQGAYQPGGPAGRQLDSRETDGRQPDRGADWGERTERIERVNASGYPEPRANSRSQPPGRTGTPRAADPFGAPTTSGPSRNSGSFGAPATSAPFGAVAAGRGSDGARGESSWAEGGRGTDRRSPERRSPARDTDRASLRNSGGWPAPGRDTDRANARNSGGWPVAGRGGPPADRVGDDDPLTSRAYSRRAVSDADGRSYAVAARRSQAQAQLTEEPTATFTAAASYPSDRYRARQYDTGATEVYPAARQYQAGATGEYPAQYPAGTNAASAASRAERYQAGEYGQYQDRPQPPSPRYQAYGGQPGSHGSPGPSSASARRGHSAAADPSGNGSASRSAAPTAAGGPAGPSAPHSAGEYGRSNGSGGPNGAGTSGRPSGPNQAAAQPAQSAGQPVGGSGRVSLPSGSGPHSAQYPTQSALSGQQSRQPQQRPHSQPSRHAAPSQLPAAGSGGALGGGNSAAAAAPRTTSATTGQNPYDSSVTGSYPYPSQPYPSRSAAPSTAGPVPGAANPTVDGRDARDRRDARDPRDGRDSRDSRAYRPVPSADGYGAANADYGPQGYGSARDGRR